MAGPWDKYAQPGAAPQSVTIGAPNPYKQQSQQQDLTKGGLDIEGKKLELQKSEIELKKAQLGQDQQKLSVEQGKAGGFYSRALDANKLYQDLHVGAPSQIREAAQGILPGSVVNSFTSPDRQQAEAAQADFIAATLRYESGAAIPPEEMEAQRRRYFPVAGDSPETIKLKERLRQNAISALQTSAGPAATAAEKVLSDKPETDVGYKLKPEQQAAYDQLVQSGASPDQLRALIQGFGGRLENADDITQARDKGAGFTSAADATYNLPDNLQQRVDERVANTGAGGAAVAGGADTVSMGTFDELSALGDAFGDALNGNGFDYQGNLAANRQFQDRLQQQNPSAYLGGQIAGGLLLPTFGANDAASLGKVGAGYGAAYGAGSGEGDQRVLGALAGGATGGALGYGIGRIAQRAPSQVPPLVDPATGELNAPLDAMRPAQRVQAMRDAGIETITPGMAGGRSARVIEQGLNNLPGSAGVMEDINSAASGETRRAMQNVAQKFGTSKTLNEGGAEIQRGARDRIERAKGVITKAYDAIPISPAAKASTSATEATLTNLTQRFASNPELAQQMNSPKIQQMLEAIKGKGLSWQDLKALRTSIGEAIGERRFSESTATSDLRAVYAALSEDMQSTAAAMGPKATAAFNRANNLNRENEQIIQGALKRILGNDGQLPPEKAAAAIQAMAKGGKSTGDLKTLAQIRAATIKSGAWDEIASTLIHLGGQPANSEGRAFQPDTFVRWYADMAEPARRMLFKPELRSELDKFVAVNQQLARVKGLTNTSNTTPTMIGSSIMGGAGVATAMGQPMVLLGVVGGGIANNAMARVWTSPKFVNLMTGFTKAAASGNQNAVKSQIGRLQKLAVTNPELRGGIESLLKSIANDNAPKLGSVAASPDQGPNQQGQPQQ